MSHLSDPVCLEFLRGASASPEDHESATGTEALWAAIIGHYFSRDRGWFVWAVSGRDEQYPSARSIVAMNLQGGKRVDALYLDIKYAHQCTTKFMQSLNSTAVLPSKSKGTPSDDGEGKKNFNVGIAYEAMVIGKRIRIYKWDLDGEGDNIEGSRKDLYVEERGESYSREYGGRFFSADKDAKEVEIILTRIRDVGLNPEYWKDHYYPYAFLLASTWGEGS